MEVKKMINFNMDKAKEIFRDKIRKARKEKFEELDYAFMRAVEIGDTEEQSRVSSEKQILRDAPADPDIDAATTVQELVSSWKTDILGDRYFRD
jgi:hypothetical protein